MGSIAVPVACVTGALVRRQAPFGMRACRAGVRHIGGACSSKPLERKEAEGGGEQDACGERLHAGHFPEVG